MIFSTIRKFTIILVYCSHLAHINQIQAIELFELVIADNILNDGPLRNCMIGNYLSILMVMMILVVSLPLMCDYFFLLVSFLKEEKSDLMTNQALRFELSKSDGSATNDC